MTTPIVLLDKDVPTTHQISVAMTEDLDRDFSFLEAPQQCKHRDCDDMRGSGRYVAGEAFFNYESFGALREGLPHVSLVDRAFIGLPIAVLFGGFAATFFQFCFLPILTKHFEWTKTQTTAASMLMLFPGSCSVFIGILSDKISLFGLRRKPYMVLGCMLAALSFLAILIVFHTTTVFRPALYATLTTIASTGIQFAVIPCLALTVEFAQREHLYERGTYQSSLFAVFFVGQSIAALLLPSLLAYAIASNNLESSRLDLGQAALVLVFATACPIPFILRGIAEDKSKPARGHRNTMLAGLVELWAIMKQKVFAGILVGLCGLVFFIGTFNQTIEIARMIWSGLDGTAYPTIQVARVLPQCIAVIFWRMYLIGVNWRVVGVVGGALFIVSQLAVTIPACFDVIRAKWFYYLWFAIGQTLQGWLTILVPLIATEVTNAGQEGAVVGLIQSFVLLFVLGSSSIWDKIVRLVHAPISVVLILFDTPATRTHIFHEALFYAGISVVGLLCVLCLPQQKLDAQQRRVFGGFSSIARVVFALAFVALFSYDLVSNIQKLS